MPVNPTLLQKLIEKYGEEEGRRIYYAMEQKGHPATKSSAIKKAMEGSSG